MDITIVCSVVYDVISETEIKIMDRFFYAKHGIKFPFCLLTNM